VRLPPVHRHGRGLGPADRPQLVPRARTGCAYRAWYSAQRGDDKQGRADREEASKLYEDHQDRPDVEGVILHTLGSSAHRRCDHPAALGYNGRAST
jgi:hypothetical protein